MKVVLVFVASLDGKVTKWGQPDVTSWSSKSDQEYFKKVWDDARLIIMGSETYQTETFLPSTRHLLVVMTRDPSKYQDDAVPGKIIFTDESPALLTERFEKEGFERMLVVGGPHIASSFLREQLIDELWLTIEPKIFGLGGNFVTEEKLDISLTLISCEKVNEQGTLITKYTVAKN
ncbi:MAG TPA: dihydrofolate reductase [Bacteroidales bacterium]|nr:dihydrofolate reductase [Bacteroidales bacterium]